MSIIGCANCGGTHFGSNECPYLEKNMGEPCAVCGERTSYCCSDCAIDGAGKVYVCIADACRSQHEKEHSRAACPMTAPEREALVKALRVVLSTARPDFQWHPSEQANATAWFEALATVRNGFDEIKCALSAPVVTVTAEMVERAHEASKQFGHLGNWLSPRQARAILEAAALPPRKSERDTVLEEAARVAAKEHGRYSQFSTDRWDEGYTTASWHIANSIRALKSTTPQTGSQE